MTALEGIEVWGLWRDLLWVEILVVVETAAFLPYEVWEMAHHLTGFKALSFVINLLIVWYLVARYLRRREERLAREVKRAAEDAAREARHLRPPPGGGRPGA